MKDFKTPFVIILLILLSGVLLAQIAKPNSTKKANSVNSSVKVSDDRNAFQSASRYPDNFKPFVYWFNEIGLNKYFGIELIVDKETDGRSYRKYRKVTGQIAGRISLKMDTDSNEDVIRNRLTDLMTTQNINSLPWLKLENSPRFLIVLKPKINKRQLITIENNYFNQKGLNLWTRIFKKLSFVTNYQSKNFGIFLPIGCAEQIIFEAHGFAFRTSYGPQCMSHSSDVEVTDIFGGLSNPKVDSTFFKKNEIRDDFKAFIVKQIDNPRADFSYLSLSDNFVEVIVRGLKSEIIKGNEDWEKIQIYFVSSFSENKSTIRFMIDGAISSGAGNSYPPDTNFTTSMEPKHSQSLDEYTNEMILLFKQYLIEKYQP